MEKERENPRMNMEKIGKNLNDLCNIFLNMTPKMPINGIFCTLKINNTILNKILKIKNRKIKITNTNWTKLERPDF